MVARFMGVENTQLRLIFAAFVGLCLVACGGGVDHATAGDPAPVLRSVAPTALRILVIGSTNSSNSQRLREIGQSLGTPTYLVDGAQELKREWFDGCGTVLITAGASAPETVVQECVDYLKEKIGATVSEQMIRTEHVSFALPRELRVLQSGSPGR